MQSLITLYTHMKLRGIMTYLKSSRNVMKITNLTFSKLVSKVKTLEKFFKSLCEVDFLERIERINCFGLKLARIKNYLPPS